MTVAIGIPPACLVMVPVFVKLGIGQCLLNLENKAHPQFSTMWATLLDL